MNRTVLQGEILRVIHNQALDAKLDHRPHEFGLSVAPTHTPRQPQGREQLIAQSQFLFIVFRSRDRQDRAPTSRFAQVANARGFTRARIGDDHMPGTIAPGGTEHGLEPSSEGRLDEDV